MVGPLDGWDDPERQSQPSSAVNRPRVDGGMTRAAEYLDVTTQPIPVQQPHTVIETDTFTPGLLDTKPIILPTIEELEGARNA